MVELLAAMLILAVGLLALFTMLQAGTLAIRRAAITSTTSALADAQMERFRAATFDALGLTGAALAGTDATYSGDGVYRPPGSNQPGQAVTVASSSFLPTQTLTGADGRTYRVDTYMGWQQVPTGRNVKLLTVVVRDTSTARERVRTVALFDQATGS